MTLKQKEAIRAAVHTYVARHSSQRAAAATLKDVSEATIVQVLKGNWAQISAAMWRSIGKQVGWQPHGSTAAELVTTRPYKAIWQHLATAQEHGESLCLTGPAGLGKTATAQHYARSQANTYYLECAAYWNRKYFLLELLRTMGRDGSGMNVYELMDDVLRYLRQQDRPLIILDEVDKLRDEVFQFFITLYNKLHGICGIVWLSTDAVVKKLRHGLDYKRAGYNEIWSRIGRNALELPRLTRKDLQAVVSAAGISDEEEVARILNTCEGDLRRIDREYLRSVLLRQASVTEKELEAA